MFRPNDRKRSLGVVKTVSPDNQVRGYSSTPETNWKHALVSGFQGSIPRNSPGEPGSFAANRKRGHWQKACPRLTGTELGFVLGSRACG
jgi:hypothetical protein